MNGSQVIAETAENKKRTAGIPEFWLPFLLLFLGFTPIFWQTSPFAGFSPLALVTLRTAIAVACCLFSMLILHRTVFLHYPVGLIGWRIGRPIQWLGSILYYSALTA
jgi:hypothetical protein